ncbi:MULTISPECIES: 3'-5' exonuclease [unclassified Corynebacterium]|uniref:3'-5' exonuclease n=1 Tax=unclassified Corynebacterium TaxID=2624378 RepID=UPI0026512907|nr:MULTISPECIES: 3'-5' exonuclease [unclassified Corynebacterium]MDN8595099.1 3'-5' exonuclease [Corynebacterium sp. P4_F2]WKK54723.1 3'-5' exonuclease [Corynebacterium sp. P4-C1]WKK64101.1 3'-5' exonuclease [Corynebacterium sp. P8-C1]
MVTFSFYSGLKLDGALYKPVMNFLQKLAEDPANPSLRIKTLNNAVDRRVRTGRVNDQFRAVLFEIKDAETHHFVLVDVDSHDEGNAKAKRLDPARLRLTVNPVNGLTQLIEEEAPSSMSAGSTGESESERKAKAATEAARQLAAQQQSEAASLSEKAGVNAEVVDKRMPAPRVEMERNGYTPESLYKELGVDQTLAEAVWRAESEDELQLLLDARPTWEHDAILGLVAGYTVEQVRESLGLEKLEPQESAVDEDARLLAGLRHPAAELDFAYVDDVDTDSLRAVIEAGSFDQWRVYIHPEQRRMAEGARSGSSRVFGGAGTGKTVVAVHRANNLARRAVPNQEPGERAPRVLLTTFTKGLAQGLKSQLNALNSRYPEAANPGEDGIWVDNVDAVVRQVLTLASPAETEAATERVLGVPASRVRPYLERDADQVWETALESASNELPRTIANRMFLQQEYEGIVLAGRITSQAEYLKVARTGRGTPLSRKQRKLVWAVIESVMQTQAVDGQLFWPTMSAVGAEVLNVRYENGGGSLFDHVVVDEAQDFNAGHWRFLRACVAEGPNDIFIAEDSHQRIYGQPLTLSRFGISTRGRASSRLTLNYRTTKENLEYALQILVGEEGLSYLDAEGETDSVAGYRSARTGPRPYLVRVGSEDQEFDVAEHFISQWMDSDRDVHIGVMCRTRGQISRVVSGLADKGIDAVATRNAERASHEQVSVMTMHGAKGMEFTHVLLMGVGKELMPLRFRLKDLSEEDAREALQRDRSLLYVAASRARDELVITATGEPSELLPESGSGAES